MIFSFSRALVGAARELNEHGGAVGGICHGDESGFY